MAERVLTIFDDPKQLELINAIIEKTQEGRLRWNNSTTACVARLPDGTKLIFALASRLLFLKAKTWAHFVVRQQDGTEIVKVQQTDPSGLEKLAGKGSVELAVDQLFKLVSKAGTEGVNRVIQGVKNL